MSIFSWGLVREREWPGDPSGVWRPEPDPPGDQTAAPAARYDPGRAAPIRLCRHRRGRQKGDDRWVGAGEHVCRTCTWILRDHLTTCLNKLSTLCCISLLAWCRQSTTVGLCLSQSAWGSQKPERVEVSCQQSPCCWVLVSTLKLAVVVVATNITIDPWHSRKTREIPVVKTPSNNI